jgi:hypothetical protein
VIAEHLTQRLVQEVRGRVVSTDVRSSFGVNYKTERIALPDRAIFNMNIVNEEIPCLFVDGQDPCN